MIETYNIPVYLNHRADVLDTRVTFTTQDSEAYTLIFHIKDYDGAALDVSTSDHATIKMAKPDGEIVINAIPITDAVNGVLTYQVGTTELTADGLVRATIQLYNLDETSRITTQEFTFNVKAEIAEEGAIPSTTEYGILTTLISEVEVLQAASPHPVDSVNGKTGDVILTTDDLVEGTAKFYPEADSTKLSGIEENATGDMTPAELKVAYESNLDTNGFSDGDKSKLDGIEHNATGDLTFGEIKSGYEANPNTNAFDDASLAKLASIQEGAQINPSTTDDLAQGGSNLYYPAVDKAKLSGIQDGAQANQTNGEIKISYEANSDTNAFTDAEKAKLAGLTGSGEANDPLTTLQGNTFNSPDQLVKLDATGKLPSVDGSQLINVPSAIVDSVNGKIGSVVLSTTDIAEGTNKYYTDAKVAAAPKVVDNDSRIGINETNIASNAALGSSNLSKIGVLETDNTQNKSDILNLANTKANKTYVDSEISAIVGPAPAPLNTLSELSQAVDNDPLFHEGVSTRLAGKVDKVDGQTLSEVNYSQADKAKLDTIDAHAEQNDPNTTTQGNSFNGNSELLLLDNQGRYPALDGSLITNLPSGGGNVDSVNGEVGVVVLDTDNIAEGAVNKYADANATNQGNTFNGNSQLVQLDATGKLPAIDGSQLMNLPGLEGGTVTSVNGYQNVVVLDSDDIAEGLTNEYYTEAKVDANTNVAANTAHRTNDGSDHEFINQDVKTTSTPSFEGVDLDTTIVSEPSYKEGRTFWDPTKKQSTTMLDSPNIRLNNGFEVLGKAYWPGPGALPNGTVIYPTHENQVVGALELPILGLADSQYKERTFPIAVTTEALAGPGVVYVTKLGAAGGIDTSAWTGTSRTAYLGAAGAITPNRPDDGHYPVIVGHVVKVDAANGALEVNISASELTIDVTNQNGFPREQRFSSTISVDDGTRTFNMNKISDYHFYQYGIKYEISSNQSVIFPNIEGLHAFYYDLGELKVITNPTEAQFEDIVLNRAFVAAAYWDATNGRTEFLLDERHGLMDPDTHLRLHQGDGTIFLGGMELAVTDIDDVSPTTDLAVEYSLGEGYNKDEDIQHTIIGKGVGDNIREYAFIGVNGDLRRQSENPYGLSGATRPYYNEFTGATWQLTETPDNSYFYRHIYAVPEADKTRTSFISIMGLATYGSKGDAEAGIRAEEALIESKIISPEYTHAYGILYRTRSSYTNTYKARIESTVDGGQALDFRTESITSSSSNIVASSHIVLTDRDAANSHPADAISFDNIASGLAATEVQSALNETVARVTQNETDITGKAPVIHTHVEADITDLDKYTTAEVDGLVNAKADTIHAHVESDITDLDKYTTTEVDDKLALKADLVGGKVPSSQLPAYVDEVQDYANEASFPATGLPGTIYVAYDTNDTYRWTGSVYIKISDVLSATEVKALYEGNADTNAFNDAYKAQVDANAAKTGITPAQAADIVVNNAKVGITPTQSSDITANNAKISYDDAIAVGINTAKVGITPEQAQDIVDNNAKVTYDAQAAVAANTAKVGYTEALVSANVSVVANTAKVGITTTQADSIVESETRISNHIGASTGAHASTAVSYSNTVSGLTGINAQEAIDELADLVDGIEALLAAI